MKPQISITIRLDPSRINDPYALIACAEMFGDEDLSIGNNILDTESPS